MAGFFYVPGVSLQTDMNLLNQHHESEKKKRLPDSIWYLLLALIAFLFVSTQLDCAQDLYFTGAGPGMTVDEPFNVGQGVFLVRAIEVYGLGIFSPDSLREIFEHPNYLPDHPPLGRLLIGISHELVSWLAGSDDRPFVVTYGRYASAFSFACLVFVVGWFTFLQWGHKSGLIAAATLICLPRLFGHAHLAALEMVTALFYVLAVLSVVHFWNLEQPPGYKRSCLTGLLLGLALLTKIQAVLIPIPVIIWALWKWRQKAIVPLLCWGSIGVLIFFAGWPWLWFDPVDRISEYLGRTTERAALYVEYFGIKYSDRNLPWHYPWVMFLTSIPVGLSLFGLLGFWKTIRSFRETPNQRPGGEILLLLSLLWPLILFSLPGITVYDGVRLFLMVFPLTAVFIGRGAAIVIDWVNQQLPAKFAITAVALLLLSQSYATFVLAPCWLSYYSLLTRGLNGANVLGMEVTYWGDSITADMLQQVVNDVPENSVIQVAPVLHPAYLQTLQETPELKRKGIQLVPFESEKPVSEYVLYFQRNPYLPEILQAGQQESQNIITEVSRSNIPLARLIRLNSSR
ncbi:ArnT family glycosyltransferase [Gimesia aquarii]|uniref:Dolichyl-phosphate-mannose-protein mannosyltransferase n=1 Tax=Gimesia aquarii TaxID=2527964 RepID=A0A517W444_9PLAN|nr:phospholipid carrier-dependent glycosyltransferase [Gimesia aquarii]QDU00027.1 Dolichyl-phosphate-mannose-protein mannosyltransferase [Gimesia aquarii]